MTDDFMDAMRKSLDEAAAQNEPSNNSRQMARAIRDMYDGFIAEKFTAEQALELVKTLITTQFK